jgi:isocitrate dehydrogenase (NAD+)
VRPARSIPNLDFGYNNVDVVVVRENTEGEYSGIEHMVKPGVAQSIKLITKEASLRVAKHAFQYAVAHKRERVTAVHKANIMKMSDGLFLEACDEAAAEFPMIRYENMTVDNACLLVRPRRAGEHSTACDGLLEVWVSTSCSLSH